MTVLAIQDVYEQQKASGTFLPNQLVAQSNVDNSVINSLDLANTTLSDLHALCKRLKVFTLEPTDAAIFDKMTWLREQRRVKKIEKDLKNAAIQLMTALGALNAYVICLSLSRDCDHIQLLIIGRQINRSLSLRCETYARIEHQKEKRRIEQLEVNQNHRLMKTETDIQNLHEKMDRAQAARLQRQDRLQLKVSVTNAEDILKTVSPNRKDSVRGLTGPSNIEQCFKGTQNTRISMRASQLRCTKGCSCLCHRRRTYRSPPVLARFFGALSIGCAGIPRVTPPCDIVECAQRSSPTVLISFIFPSWFLARALAILGRLTPMNGPEMMIRVPRVVGDNALIFDRCAQNDICAVRELLRDGLASTSDVRCTTGETPLHVNLCSAIIAVWRD